MEEIKVHTAYQDLPVDSYRSTNMNMAKSDDELDNLNNTTARGKLDIKRNMKRAFT